MKYLLSLLTTLLICSYANATVAPYPRRDILPRPELLIPLVLTVDDDTEVIVDGKPCEWIDKPPDDTLEIVSIEFHRKHVDKIVYKTIKK